MNPKSSQLLTLCFALVACSGDGTHVDGGFSDSATPSDATADGVLHDAAHPGEGGVPMTCGNGRIDPGEECDGRDLGSRSCVDLGFEGALACTSACTFDQTDCTSPGCPPGRRDCNGICVDLSASQSNCGACGVACGDDAFCHGGACRCSNSNEILCGTECILVSNENCGACGNDCGDAARCAESEGRYACHDVDLRISDEGLLEAGVNDDWRGVCDDGFQVHEGVVACRQMGLLYTSHTDGEHGPTPSFWMDELDCNGTEEALIQCESLSLGMEDCHEQEWVRLVCDEAPTPTGRVRIRDGLLEYRARGEWRGVCDDNFNILAGIVACREMGLSYRSHAIDQMGPHANFWRDELRCNGDEATLSNCSSNALGEHDCSIAEWVALSCGEL